METDVIKAAIELLAKKITDKSTADEALKFTQAALNLAHTAQTLAHVKTHLPTPPATE